MAERAKKFWGWGYENEGPTRGARFGATLQAIVEPPNLEELALRAPRVSPPAALAPICSQAPRDRAAHTYGKSFRDLVRAFRRQYSNPPDAVAFPRSEKDVVAVPDGCGHSDLVPI